MPIKKALSENLKEETLKHFDIRKHIEVIHNFVDLHRFDKKPLAAFRQVIAPNNEKIIIHASNFRKIKRNLKKLGINSKFK